MIKKIISAFFHLWKAPELVPQPRLQADAEKQFSIGACPSRGVHYFGAHDPISFWDGLRMEDVPQHFAQIRADGFDAINLLIPWHAFFPAHGQNYVNTWYGNRLLTLLEFAQSSGLLIHGRIFYSHSPVTTLDAVEHHRQYEILTDPKAAALKIEIEACALHKLVRNQAAWGGAFITWEDFWPCFEGPPHWTEAQRIKVGYSSGFSDWIGYTGLADEAKQQGLLYLDGSWVVPKHGARAMSLWQRFFDYVLRERVLVPCSQSFGNLGIEVRADAYPIPSENGVTEWSYFSKFDDWSGQKMLYWGPFFGAENQGEKLTASEAKRGFEYMLSLHTSTASNTKPTVDQFNFTDETLLFAEFNARIKPDEIPSFIIDCADVFLKSTAGYALWAYRDYRENWLINPSFQRGAMGWDCELGKLNINEGQILSLRSGTTVAQQFMPEMRAQAKQAIYKDFFCEIETDATLLTVRINNVPAESVVAPKGFLKFKIANDKINWQQSRLMISNAGDTEALIACVYFYGFVQRLHVRDEYGDASQYLQAIRTLNESIVVRHKHSVMSDPVNDSSSTH
jgi:hypothetical protein